MNTENVELVWHKGTEQPASDLYSYLCKIATLENGNISEYHYDVRNFWGPKEGWEDESVDGEIVVAWAKIPKCTFSCCSTK